MLGGAGVGQWHFWCCEWIGLISWGACKLEALEPDRVLQRNGINTIYLCICAGVCLHMMCVSIYS